MTQRLATPPRVATPRIEYQPQPSWREPPDDVLFAFTFGDDERRASRVVNVPLKPLAGQGLVEVWHARGMVTEGRHGPVRFASDDHFLAGLIEVDEHQQGGIVEATAYAYRQLAAFLSGSAFPHLLRTWNYFDAINEGAGDAERYRCFCTGRVSGLAQWRQGGHPAATVIGRIDGTRVLQLYWLAGRDPGFALENPRQVSAYRYPRKYGATPPTFSRAMLVPGMLMISGTASIVGHASQHEGDVGQQVREILNNLSSLLAEAHARSSGVPRQFGAGTQIKAYVRRASDAPHVEALIREHLPMGAPLLVLQGDVCRSDLLVELDCMQTAR